ncbi:MAG TPA: nucleotide exchange factor GrpE [Candidatus Acidoferrales bacterium]|nr:nucleotide exchange factor GrpE [Candidatus Acidoferrales bacterium]
MSSHNREKENQGEPKPRVAYSAAPENANIDEPSDPAGVGSSNETEEGLDAFGEQIQKLQAEKQELMNTLVRRQADFENYRKRVEKERHQERHRGVEVLIESILPALDAFDRALDGAGDAASAEYLKGFEMIRRQFGDLLAKQGLKRIEAVGKEFNPHLHHAIEKVETHQHPDGVVIAEMQPGYMFHERVLRPAMVRVASKPTGKSIPVSRSED